jgi:hypothetical protein
MIEIEDVDIDASKDEDEDGEDDGQDDGIKTNRGLWWYFAQYKAASGTITSQAYRGKQNMISELKSRFGFSSWNKGSYDRFAKDISVSIYSDKSERQAAIKQYLYSSTENNNNGSSSEVLLDLYTSHHLPANRNTSTNTSTMSVFAVVDKATITDKGVELKDVVSWENELPKFVGDLSDANVSKFVTGRLGKGGLSIKDLENGLKDGNLLCLEFRGWNTRSDKSFASFLENRMGLTEDKAKKEANLLRRRYHSREASPWCHLVFTSRLIEEAKMNQDMRVLYRYRVFHMKNLSGQNNAENAIGKMLYGFHKSSSGHEYEVLRSSKEWQTHSFEYKKGYRRWSSDSLNSMMQGIWAEYEFKDALKSVDTKTGWRRYKVPVGRGETEFLEYNQDTLDQSAVGEIPYMYLPQSEKDCYVVVVIQRDLPR